VDDEGDLPSAARCLPANTVKSKNAGSLAEALGAVKMQELAAWRNEAPSVDEKSLLHSVSRNPFVKINVSPQNSMHDLSSRAINYHHAPIHSFK
jgi:hypothetical protein